MVHRHFRFGGPIDVSIEDWDDHEAIARRHRRQLAALAIGLAVIVVLSIVLHPVLLAFGLFLVPFMLIEWWMIRSTRPTVKIPDYRPPDPVEVELDEG